MSPSTRLSKRVWRFLLPLGVCTLLLSAGLWRATVTADKAAPKAFGSKAKNRGGVLPLFKSNPPVGASLLLFSSTITANSTAQSPGLAGDCTLGEAIQAANTDSAVDGCSAGGGGIDTNRTSGQNFSTRTLCGQVNSLSPFVVAQAQSPTAAPARISGQIATEEETRC